MADLADCRQTPARRTADATANPSKGLIKRARQEKNRAGLTHRPKAQGKQTLA